MTLHLGERVRIRSPYKHGGLKLHSGLTGTVRALNVPPLDGEPHSPRAIVDYDKPFQGAHATNVEMKFLEPLE